MTKEDAIEIVTEEALSVARNVAFRDRDTATKLSHAIALLTGKVSEVYAETRYSGRRDEIETTTWHIEFTE